MNPADALIELIQRRSRQPAPVEVRVLGDRLLARYGDAVQAILFYGSCLRSGDALDGLVDLYVVVDCYRHAYPGRMLAIGNQLLPPNVFYLEVPLEHGIVRAKYAVVSVDDLRRGSSEWFHSYLWGRFAQPVGLLYARDDEAAGRVVADLARAVVTFIARTLPRLPESFDAVELWRTGLRLSYQAELRAERADRVAQLVGYYQEYYEKVTRAAMTAVPYCVSVERDRYRADIPAGSRRLSLLGWVLRRWQGKLLSLLRLSKALFTFHGGVDYIVWKLERHSGVAIEVPARVRKYPLVLGWGFVWRLYRRGVFR